MCTASNLCTIKYPVATIITVIKIKKYIKNKLYIYIYYNLKSNSLILSDNEYGTGISLFPKAILFLITK